MCKKRKIELVITSCGECPYNHYDPHYGMSTDSGFDCYLDAPKVEDWEETKYNKAIKEWNDSQLTLFPQPEEDKPVDPMVKRFNEKCPINEWDDLNGMKETS